MAIEPQDVFCPTIECAATGQINKGNIRYHSRTPLRYRCQVCRHTFTERAGTLFHRRRVEPERIGEVETLVAYGCPIPAIQAAIGYGRATVSEWAEAAGLHSLSVHRVLVEQQRDLQQVQVDEIRVVTQRGVVWLAMALMVSTRLWLGAATSPLRDRNLIRELAALVWRCAIMAPLLVVSDGLASYPTAFARQFRTIQGGTGGRGRRIAWPDLVIAQVVKQYQGYGVTGTLHRLVQGSVEMFLTLLWQTAHCCVLNTAFIERFNGTMRSRLSGLARRTHGYARHHGKLHTSVYLMGTVYNFCTFHTSLRTPSQQRTPAMAAGITTERWTLLRLLTYRVPPPRWSPPPKRGRRSRHIQALIDRWCPDHR